MSPPSRRGFIQGGVGLAALGVAGVGRADTELGTGPAPPPPGPGETSIAATVNGESVAGPVHADETALDLLRERLGLTAAKRGCGHGACGACTVHLDGDPVASCLLPATALHGRSVTTLEGMPGLHPLQRAFLAEDALQCGYCTPGFVVEAIPFVDGWRAAHGDSEPPAHAVADALAGHLCRCGAYPAIVAAVQGACAGRFDVGPDHGARVDGHDKVTGAARYTVDVTLPGLLHGAILRSPHAHAVLQALDAEAARAQPGVRAITLLTPLGGTVRFAGQEIAAVAAVDLRQARRALASLVPTYTVLPASVDAAAAQAPDAPLVFPRAPRKPDNASETPALAVRWRGNVRGPFGLFTQNGPIAERRCAEADGTRDGFSARFVAHQESHTALEPHGTVARWTEGKLDVWMSTQAVSDMAEDIARRWKLPHDAVRVRSEHTGGGFGAKCRVGMDTVAAIDLARAAGAPVKVILTREEELLVGGLRPGALMDVSLAADADGGLGAMRMEAWNDAGAAVGHNIAAFWRIMYPGAPKSLVDHDVVTHTPPGEPFRGPGGPAAFFSLESAVDELAAQRGEDPIALRRRWDVNERRLALYDRVEALPLWAQRGERGAGRYRTGTGLAASGWFHFVQVDTRVGLAAGPDGVVVRCATQDMGNGARTVLARAVSEGLRLPPERIRVEIGDSALPRGPVSSGSRTTASVGVACDDAIDQLKRALVRAVGLPGARIGERGVEHDGGTVEWADALGSLGEAEFLGRRRQDRGGWFLPVVLEGLATGRALGGAVTVVRVQVDTWLGRVRATQAWAGFGVGRIRVPELARSQAYGGFVQGLGYALYEERVNDPRTGRLLTANLEDYRLPGLGDAPPMQVEFVTTGLDHVRGRSVGLGELVTVGVPAAIANAVRDATGWRPTELPLRPDRVLAGLRSLS